MNPYNPDRTASETGVYPQAPGPYLPPPAYPGYPGRGGENMYPPVGAYPQSPEAYPPAMYPTGYPAAGAGASTYPADTNTLSPTGFGFAALYSLTANYAYFRHVNGERSWNPFAGLWKKNS